MPKKAKYGGQGNKMKKLFARKNKGFTLIEMMVSIFIFAIMMTAISGIFARQISSYKQTRLMAGDLENAQFALNYIAKTLRTASIIGEGTSSSTGTGNGLLIERNQNGYEDDFWSTSIDDGKGLIVYDFSQEACIIFTFRDSPHEGYQYPALWMESQTGVVGIDDIEACLDAVNWDHNDDAVCTMPDCAYKEQRLTTGSVTGEFMAAPTRYMDHVGSRSTDTIGRATISMEIIPAEYVNSAHVRPVNIQSSVSLRDYPSDLSF